MASRTGGEPWRVAGLDRSVQKRRRKSSDRHELIRIAGQTWLANYTIAARAVYPPFFGSALDDTLGSSSLLAVHGGIHPSWSDIARINRVGTSLMSRIVNARIPSSMELPRDSSEEERDFYSPNGPVWYRGYALDSDTDDVICEVAEEVLRRTNTTRMVIGHTPNFSRIVSRCRGKIIIIDT